MYGLSFSFLGWLGSALGMSHGLRVYFVLHEMEWWFPRDTIITQAGFLSKTVPDLRMLRYKQKDRVNSWGFERACGQQNSRKLRKASKHGEMKEANRRAACLHHIY